MTLVPTTASDNSSAPDEPTRSVDSGVARPALRAVTVAPESRPTVSGNFCSHDHLRSPSEGVLQTLCPKTVAALIPAYQAETWIDDVARRAARQVGRVLVVDDGSTDRTCQRAMAVGEAVEVLRTDRNCGKGAALRVGFRSLLQDPQIAAIVTVDADGQHLPEEIPKLIAAASRAELVLGSRDHLFAEMSWLRRCSNSLSSRIISLAAGRSLGDVQTGFRLYRRRLLEQVPMAEDRFEAESAVVVRAARRGFQINCVGVDLGTVDGRPTSHYRPLIDSLRITLAVLAARSLGR